MGPLVSGPTLLLRSELLRILEALRGGGFPLREVLGVRTLEVLDVPALEIPDAFAGFGVQRDQRVSKEIVAKTIAAKPRPRGENVVDLMDALKKSLATEAAAPKGKKPKKRAAGQKEMLLPIEGKKPAEKKAAKPERSGRRKAG